MLTQLSPAPPAGPGPPKGPLLDEWIKKMWYIYTIEYYSAIKKNEILPFASTGMDLKGIMISEISQTEIQALYDFTYMWNLKTNEKQAYRYRE